MRPFFRHFSLACAALCATAYPDVSSALIFGNDDREVVSSDPGSLFAPIGIVYGVPESAYATAFLIDDCDALTVQHVFGDTRSSVGRKIIYAAGVSGPVRHWRLTRATVVADGGLERIAANGDGYFKRTADWALLRLSKCLGRTFGHVRIAVDVPKFGTKIAMAGYPIDAPLSHGLEIDPSCRVREERSGVLLHDCAQLPGNSGSPLYRVVSIKGKQTLEVFAMATAGHSFKVPGSDLISPVTQYYSNYANVATPICGVQSHSHRRFESGVPVDCARDRDVRQSDSGM